MKPSKRLLAISGAAVLGAATMAGCSQVASLKQVSGVGVTTLQIAADEVLTSNNVKVLVAPTCETDGSNTDLICHGQTVDKQPIVVTGKDATAAKFELAPGGTPSSVPNGTLNMTMEVKVGDKVIYSGLAQDAINESAVK